MVRCLGVGPAWITTARPGEDPTRIEAETVRRLLDDVGLASMIDVHTHFMPKRVLDKVWAYFDGVGPLTGRPWPVAYRHDEQARVAALRDFGVVAFTSLLYPHKPDMAEWLNSWSAQFAAATPDCLHTATFYPEPGAADYVSRAIADGARVFKAHVQVGNYSPKDPLLEPVWAVLERAGVPTVIHAGSGPTPGTFTGPQPVADVLDRHPDLKLIIAHLGMPEYREFIDLAQQHAGVYLDTTMVFTDFTEELHPFPRAELPRLLEVADKVLFGSDFPNIPYPYHHAVESVVALGLGDQWSRKVLFHNAFELFN
ncbi:putative amidohydrolase [Mycobacterium kiyosense]|uniref:Amidohydrolase n=2 Tax=Mycobacteriaceae TaxID=1762 RepID=A0AA37PTA1_9MYCO|nr:putative amidohydrolase [Mycobacterium sp. 20KCMC460]GLB82510.1 putative amidohydrolase [Mycobacterium kiyosense]GLB90285.1 putative amidohydrolase [Mycobacterium kiyosense]GLB93888.1 putative amidohydrolase [Mycobacterium kiyosense]GLC00611.1 putative amidohydrolase [Mycobacterium kiyosense]